MNKTLLRITILGLIMTLLLAGAALAQEEPKTPVLVALRPAELSAQGVERAQRQVLDALPPEQARVRHRFERLPGLAVDVTAAGLESLRRNPAVLAVSEDLPVRAALADSAAFIGAAQARAAFGVTGSGIGVAVLDSGIDTDHPDFGGHIIAQHCFNKGNTCPPGNTPESDSAEDANGHGTHVSGIVAGGGLVAPPGIAPAANLVAVRVLDSGGAGYTSDVLAGIDWVVSRQAELNVKVINLSLGGGSYSGVCDAADANTLLYAAAVEAARAAGISLFAAAGNSGQADGLLTPACISGVMAVGNVYNNALPQGAWPTCTDTTIAPDTVACSSNSSDELDLLAPGTLITSAGLGGGTRTESGTSMATPHAAGLAALLLEADSGLLPDTVEALLRATGAPVTDARTGRTTPRIDALAAVAAVQPMPPLTGTVRLEGRSVFGGTTIFSGPTCEGITQSEPAVTTDASGGFSLAQPGGCVLAAHPGYLSALAESPAGGPGETTLPVGDLNGDEAINILDLSLIARSYRSSDPAADVDASGIVDIFDLVLTARNFNLQGPVTWGAE